MKSVKIGITAFYFIFILSISVDTFNILRRNYAYAKPHSKNFNVNQV
jgi:hypothetical protein